MPPKADVTGSKREEVRVELEEKLREEGRDDLADVLARCREQLSLKCLCCDATFAVDRGCGKRWCPVCAPRVSAKRFARAERLARRFQWPLSVALTRVNVDQGEGCIEDFKAAFRAFRRTAFWSGTVAGGIAGFEVTHRGRGFHPHLHAMIDCEWLAVATPKPQRGATRKHIAELCKRAQTELGEVWGAYIQGRRAQVWVQRVTWADGDGLSNTVRETLKYAIKPGDLLKAKCNASQIIDEMDRGRLMTTFGHAHGSSKDFVGIDDPEPVEKLCRSCGWDRTILPEAIVDKLHRNMIEPRGRVAVVLAAREEMATAASLGITREQLRAVRAMSDDEQAVWWEMRDLP